MTSSQSKTTPIQIARAGGSPVVFTTDDFDRFVLTQREVFEAVEARQVTVEDQERTGRHFASFVYDLHMWCKQHGVDSCVIAPRLDDTIVVIVTRDEDEGGVLHDKMSQFDLDSFARYRLRLYWMLLRASEASGLSAFVDPPWARTVYRADT